RGATPRPAASADSPHRNSPLSPLPPRRDGARAWQCDSTDRQTQLEYEPISVPPAQFMTPWPEQTRAETRSQRSAVRLRATPPVIHSFPPDATAVLPHCNASAPEDSCASYKSCVAYNFKHEESPKAGRSSWNRNSRAPRQQPPSTHSRTPDHA